MRAMDPMEAFALELQKNPHSTGYLVAYRSASRDGPRVAQTSLRNERNYLIKEYGIKPGRIKTVAGGYREWRAMELWISQEHGAVPIITSYRYSPKRRRR
ncbi:MAG TPA: hypothetical protein VGJ66_26185 [Pyrinomonadaceae bacterium]|jgi:hypothetical protein